MGKYVVNVDGIIGRGGEYLLIERGTDEEHAAGLLGLPGGQMENQPDDNRVIEKTVRRELNEEVGVRVGDVTYVYSNTFEMDTGSICLNVLMACEYLDGEPYAKADDEVADIHWMTYDEVIENESIPEFTEQFITLVENADIDYMD